MNPFKDKATRATRHLALVLLASLVLSSCGGGGGGSPAPDNAATTSSSAIANSNTIVMSDAQTGQIANTIANADGSMQLVTTANSTLGAALSAGSVVQVAENVDTRYPLGLVGKVASVTTGSDGVTSATLTNATLADVVQKSSFQTNEVELNSTNFIGVISPKAVQASTTAQPKSIPFLQQGITALNGGLVLTEPNLLGRIANGTQSGLSFLGGNGAVDAGEIKLTMSIKLGDMGLDPSRFKPFGTGAEASFDIVGSIKNLKLIENHDFDTTAGVTTGLKSMDMRVTGDIDVRANLHGGVDADLGYFSQAWKEVEDEQMKLLGVSAKLTGLDSKDKIGKYPIAGLVFSVPCPLTGCPVLAGQTQTPLRAAKAGGVIVWVYITASGKIVLDGEVGARLNAARFNLGVQKPEGGKLDNVFELSNTGTGRLIEAPYFDGTTSTTMRFGPEIDADFFVLGVRVANVSAFVGGQNSATLKTTTPISFGTTKLGDPWTWQGQACLQHSIGAGAIVSAAIDVGVEVDTLFKKTSAGFAYSGVWPTEEAILIPGGHGFGDLTWYTSKASKQCFPTPAVNNITTTQDASTSSLTVTVSGTNLPDDLLLGVSPAANCAGIQKTVTSNTSVSFTCQVAGTVTGLIYNLSSLKAENIDLSTVGSQLNYTVSPFTPTQTVVITQVLDDLGASTGPLAQGATTDDTTPGLSGTLSAALTATQRLIVYNGSTSLGAATVSGTSWSFTPTALAVGNYSFTAAVVSVDGIEGIRTGAWGLNIGAPALPVVTITASPSSIANGATSTLNWSSTNSTSCTSSGGGGTGTAGSFTTPALTATTTYTVTCTGAGGTASQSATVTVAGAAKPMVSAGGCHSLGLKPDATVVAWEFCDYGFNTVPAGLANVVAVAAGYNHSLALKSDGTVVAWGNNFAGKSTVPAGLSNVVAVAAGYNHSLALKSDGTVVAWGYNVYGQTTVPAGLSSVVAVAGGEYRSLALKSDGTVVAWGKIRDGLSLVQATVPVGLSNVIAVAAGEEHSLALKSDGTVVAWGGSSFTSNWYGESTVPAGLTNVVVVAAGRGHSMALKSDGTVVAWGAIGFTRAQNTLPVGLANVVAVSAGYGHSLSLKSDGTVVGSAPSGGQSTVPAGLNLGITASPPVTTAPTVQSLAASAVTTAAAQINGSVNANGLSTGAYFEYGTTTSYGNTSGETLFSSTYAAALSMYWTGLTPNTTYHYRVVATNTSGTSRGENVMFITAASALPTGYVVQGGLTWMPISATPYTYAQATALCGGTINGQTGWRLPTLTELSGLTVPVVDGTVATGGLYGSGAMYGQGWTLGPTLSSTSSGSGTHYFVYLNSGIYSGTGAIGGSVSSYFDTGSFLLTCVR